MTDCSEYGKECCENPKYYCRIVSEHSFPHERKVLPMTEFEMEIIEQYRLLTPEQKVIFRQNLKKILSSCESCRDRPDPDGEDPQ